MRHENDSVRPLVDNDSAAYILGSFPPSMNQKLKEWSDPNLAITYLFLKPGFVIPKKTYWISSVPSELMRLSSFSDYLRVLKQVFLESTDLERGQISLVAARFGHCLNTARRMAKAMRSPEFGPGPSLNVINEWRTDEFELRLMISWSTKETILKEFDGRAEVAVDKLTLNACRGGQQVRSKARELLTRFFSISPSTLPCIPCE